ncbi:MAG TPA: hypothetical protein ENH13_00335 [Euryarchaeota archaeon]|nr:hypothetical protein [Euryarchaeota archaeon]
MKSDGSKEKSTEKGEAMSRRLIIFLGMLFIIVAGVSTYIVLNRGGGGVKTDSAGVDPLINELIRTSPSGLPEYAFTSRKTQAGYAAAAEIPEILEKIPCYCSCGAVGHTSLKDCFTKGGGDHASYCDLCVDETLDVYRWQKEGVPLAEIRSRVDEKYSRFGEPNQ